jgi:hypothetical protein
MPDTSVVIHLQQIRELIDKRGFTTTTTEMIVSHLVSVAYIQDRQITALESQVEDLREQQPRKHDNY